MRPPRSDNLDDGKPGGQLATPWELAGAVKMFRESAGDQGTWDFQFYVDDLNQSVHEAADSIMHEVGFDEAMPRLEALRRYAATVAP
jgi:hypothetical protein